MLSNICTISHPPQKFKPFVLLFELPSFCPFPLLYSGGKGGLPFSALPPSLCIERRGQSSQGGKRRPGLCWAWIPWEASSPACSCPGGRARHAVCAFAQTIRPPGSPLWINRWKIGGNVEENRQFPPVFSPYFRIRRQAFQAFACFARLWFRCGGDEGPPDKRPGSPALSLRCIPSGSWWSAFLSVLFPPPLHCVPRPSRLGGPV